MDLQTRNLQLAILPMRDMSRTNEKYYRMAAACWEKAWLQLYDEHRVEHPLFLDGSRMLASYPVIPLARGQALAIGLTSYDGGVSYGLNGDREAMPDLDDLRRCIIDALSELLEAAR